MASKQATITELPADADMFDMLRQTLNRGLMVDWINRDLINRADCDIRKSVVFYDVDRVFVMALGTSVTADIFRARIETMPNVVASMQRMGIRYYSIGVK